MKALASTLAVVLSGSCHIARAADPTPAEIRAIAKEAYIYGYPMVDGYRVQYTYFVDREHPNYKCPWNQINNNARVNTPEVFNLMSFILQFCPVHASEKELRAKFAAIGIAPGKRLDFTAMPEATRAAYQRGMADAWKDFAELQKKADSGELTSADAFGTREDLKNNYMLRWAGAVLGIYGNTAAEAIYPLYFVDAERKPLNAAEQNYTLRFEPGQLPPVNAFWSVTMYDLPDRFLVGNPLNRYLINSPMLPQLKKDADGGLTIYIQHESPGKDREPNWLPAPKGPFFMSMRLYYPKPEALNGQWKEPKAQSAQTDNPVSTKP